MYTLGVNLSHHSSIALLKDNEVLLFLHEERVNRKKYYRGVPAKSLDHIKRYTKTIDYISVVSGTRQELLDVVQYLKQQKVEIKGYGLNNQRHHLAHAAAGFYMSQMDRATIFVVDGAGAIITFKDSIRASETTSVYKAAFPTIKCIKKRYTIGLYDPKPLSYTKEDKIAFRKRFSIPTVLSSKFDIGWEYASVTSQIGFGVFGEGKTMGLSAYGQDKDSDSNAITAYNIQKKLEQYFKDMVDGVEGNIVLSGGCALNILGNSHIKRVFPNLNIFIDPIAADGTVALGAASYHFYTTTQSSDKLVFTPYQGPEYNINKNFIYECARRYSI